LTAAPAAAAQQLDEHEAYSGVLALTGSLPKGVGRSELLLACQEGKGRVVDSFFAQTTLTEAAEARAHEVLAASVEMAAEHNRGAVLKTLIDHGADAHRTAALHLAIRNGHVNIVQHLVTKVGVSVNAVDGDGRSPLHVAAAANQPKVATLLIKHCASIDATDPDGCTAYDIAVSLRWKEMQRVLTEPSVLFWNRSSRASRLYKQQEYELACEHYEAALRHLEQMETVPSNDTLSTVCFNYGRAAQAMGSLSLAISLFTRAIAASKRHERAVDNRAECHLGLGDYEAAQADLRELTTTYTVGADVNARQAWLRRLADIHALQRAEPHEILGVDRFATAADVRKAYHHACLQHHPDKHASSGDDARAKAKHHFRRIQAAYERLSASSANGGGAQRNAWQARAAAGAYGAPAGNRRYASHATNAWWDADGFDDDEGDE